MISVPELRLLKDSTRNFLLYFNFLSFWKNLFVLKLLIISGVLVTFISGAVFACPLVVKWVHSRHEGWGGSWRAQLVMRNSKHEEVRSRSNCLKSRIETSASKFFLWIFLPQPTQPLKVGKFKHGIYWLRSCLTSSLLHSECHFHLVMKGHKES